ncbi:hypothetical protein ABK040_007058 [Willaertia magna]
MFTWVISTIFAFLLKLIDRCIYYLLRLTRGRDWLPLDSRGISRKVHTVQVDTDQNHKPGQETKPRRGIDFEKELVLTPFPEVTNISEYLDALVKRFGDKPMLGARPFIGKSKQLVDGKEWDIMEYGPVEYESYNQIYKRVNNLAKGIVRLTGLNSNDIFGIYEETRKEWMIALHACMRYNITVMTVYATLGEDALELAINECQTTAMLVSEGSLGRIIKWISKTPSLKYLIYTKGHGIPSSVTEKHVKELNDMGITVISFEEVEKLGEEEVNPVAVKQPQKIDDIAMIMYTSGTTGDPKGVMLKTRNFLSMSAATTKHIDLKDSEYILVGYLPLAHIFELIAEHFILTKGGRIGYGSPRTLTSKTCKPVGDLEAIKPTMLIGVPRVFDTIKKGVMEKITTSGKIVSWLFNVAYSAKKDAISKSMDTPLFNFLVFRKIKNMVNDKLAIILSGGAPLSADSMEFLRVVFGCSVVQGYGLTETAAGGGIGPIDAPFRTKSIGAALGAFEVKLISVPDMGYSATDNPPKGELAIRGNSVSAGYYKQPEKTKESYLPDGWFLTGDIAQFNEDGTISIIDRKKNLVKLAQGEYVALEKLESIYGTSPFVQLVMIYADSFQSYAVGIASVLPGYITRWANEHGITGTLEEICNNPKVVQAVLHNLREIGIHGGLKGIELINHLKLVPDEWTPENELLTAANKIKRQTVVKKYQKEIDEMYKTSK